MFFAAIDEIKHSSLGKTAKVNALLLLDLAHADNGHVMITWDELAALWGVAVPTSRRHLGDLQTANVLHYSTNGDRQTIYINFKAWVRARVDARNSSPESTKNARGSDENRAWARGAETEPEADDQKTRVDARNSSPESTKNARGRAISGADLTRTRGLDPDPNTGREVGRKDLPTYQPDGGEGEDGPDQDEQARSIALLTDPDVGMWRSTATELAVQYPFDEILRHVIAWRWQFEAGEVRSPRVLVGRLRRSAGLPLTERDRSSPLYLRHISEDEVMAQRHAELLNKYLPPEFRGSILGYPEE